jgi:hypothetical protein
MNSAAAVNHSKHMLRQYIPYHTLHCRPWPHPIVIDSRRRYGLGCLAVPRHGPQGNHASGHQHRRDLRIACSSPYFFPLPGPEMIWGIVPWVDPPVQQSINGTCWPEYPMEKSQLQFQVLRLQNGQRALAMTRPCSSRTRLYLSLPRATLGRTEVYLRRSFGWPQPHHLDVMDMLDMVGN